MVAPGKRRRDESEGVTAGSRSPRRAATVFDAVAGRVGYEALLKDEKTTKDGNKYQQGQAVRPEEVLFRRQGAPPRYHENDPYFANDQLGPTQKLPDSDMLKHLHTYASDFYRSATPSRGRRDWRSMDETALLALGILLEETAAQSLGATGDLALLESEVPETHSSRPAFWDGHQWIRSVLEQRSRPKAATIEKSRPRRREGSSEEEDVM
ncbi:hypothetical protein MBLNU457_g2899t1 [Dothideomycetes sp. NU457]